MCPMSRADPNGFLRRGNQPLQKTTEAIPCRLDLIVNRLMALVN